MKIAVIRIRGSFGVRRPVADALKQMKLTRVNHCVLLEDCKANRKLLNTLRDLVTWGEASDETVTLLEKGKAPYRLNPPRKGYGGIKIHYPKGALGDRGKEINELVKRML